MTDFEALRVSHLKHIFPFGVQYYLILGSFLVGNVILVQIQVNAILSYGYSFLEREVRACLVTAGLDVRIGVLHSTNNRKDSFVYDVMDLLRQEVIDRFILKALNTHRFNVSDFDISEQGCYMAKESNKNGFNYMKNI